MYLNRRMDGQCKNRSFAYKHRKKKEAEVDENTWHWKVETDLMPVEPLDRGAGHPVAAVLGRVIVVHHHAVADDGGRAGQREARVREEATGAGNVAAATRHGKVGVLVGQVAHLAVARLLGLRAVPVHTEIEHHKWQHFKEI